MATSEGEIHREIHPPKPITFSYKSLLVEVDVVIDLYMVMSLLIILLFQEINLFYLKNQKLIAGSMTGVEPVQ